MNGCYAVCLCVSGADKGIPPCSQESMETLIDMREAYQEAGRGGRWAR